MPGMQAEVAGDQHVLVGVQQLVWPGLQLGAVLTEVVGSGFSCIDELNLRQITLAERLTADVASQLFACGQFDEVTPLAAGHDAVPRQGRGR